MKPIAQQHLRRACDLQQLDASNAAIAAVPAAERSAFIEAHESECSAIRGALWGLGHMKCWYSEASLQQCEGHVEHYRPKRRPTGAVGHAGYWWRAFDWKNLRLAHPTVNLRKTDYLSGKRVGKGSYFPLRDESQRATQPAEEENEQPTLLDPVKASDTLLLCFSESGAPRPRYSAEQNEWLHRRAAESIRYYHLDEGSWNAKRADLMAVVKILCERLQMLASEEPRSDAAYGQTIDELIGYIGPFAEFSSACLQVVREMGLLEHFAAGLA